MVPPYLTGTKFRSGMPKFRTKFSTREYGPTVRLYPEGTEFSLAVRYGCTPRGTKLSIRKM